MVNLRNYHGKTMMESCKKEADEQKKMLAMAVPKFGDF
jgi:hypothetical protein